MEFSLPLRTGLQQPCTTTAIASTALEQHQNEAPTLSCEDLERLQHLPERVRQLYTTGQLVLPGRAPPRNEPQEQQVTLAPISELPETPEPRPAADHIQAQHPTTPPPPVADIEQPATNNLLVRPDHLIALLPISLLSFVATVLSTPQTFPRTVANIKKGA